MSRSWNEYELTEKPVLDLLEKLGYKVYDIEEGVSDRPTRETEYNILLEDNLRKALKRINPWISENNITKAVNEIKPARISATNMMEANELIYKKLVKYISLPQDLGEGKKNQTVKYIDFDNPENNEFIAMNQYRVKGNEVIKPDIVTFINGIPIGVIECKNETTCKEPEEEAINQLRRYQDIRDNEAEGAEKFFYTNQVVVAAWRDSASASTVGAPYREFKAWKDPYPYNKEDIEQLLDSKPTLQDILLFSIFKKERILDLMQNFTVFEQKGNSLVKMMARYQQYRAVIKALERIDNTKRADDRSGTVWHTQGSGKSLTMLFLALKLKRKENLDDPTILIVTDRIDLDEQINGTFKRCGFPNPVQAKGIDHLKELLTSEAGRTITTLIHKFQENDREEYPELTRDTDIFVMADEAHRTQFKELAMNMRKALPNACYLGFTGTPIDKETRSTLRTFGDYIDTYTIEQSVEDGATLPIKYEGRLPELQVINEDIDDIFEAEFENYSDEEKKKMKEKYATERDIAEAKFRIETITRDIIKHYREKIKPLKAQIATVSREAAAKYGNAMKRFNGPEFAVIYTSNNNDNDLLKDYSTPPEKQNQFIERFKDTKSSLKFLIVCDKLLTGFDAPVEQVMYQDKPLKEHNLLQAIARVNRVFEEKNYGLVVDYYGVLSDLNKALAIFNDSDVRNAVTPISDEIPKLEANYRHVMRFFEGVDMNDLDECILNFEDEKKRLRFKKAFKEFSKSMDIVLPDPKAEPYIKDLNKLGKIYRAVRNHYRDKSININGVGNKIKRLIDENIRASGIKRLNEPVSILDEDKFEEVLEETTNEKAKASEMEHAIKQEINVKLEENPVFYQSLKERLEEIIKKKEEGRLTIAEQIEKMGDIINNIRNVKTKAQKLGLDEREYALYELLMQERETESTEGSPSPTSNPGGDSVENYGNKKIKELTQDIMEELKQYAKIDLWREKEKVLKEMRKTIKIKLISYKEFKKKLNEITNNIMKLARNILMLL